MNEVFEGLPVKSISIENLLAQRDGILKRIGEGIGKLHEAKAIAQQAGVADGYWSFERMLQGKDHYRATDLLEEEALTNIRKRLDATTWNHLMNESGMRTLMDAKARAEWSDKIEKLDCPELTMDNVRATFGMLYDSRGEIFERGVINCFKALNWDYKTNKPFAFGKRFVIRFLRNSVTGKGSSLGWANHRVCNELDDLMRVLTVLDGKPEPDHRQGIYHLLQKDTEEERARRACGLPQRDVENDYMAIRSFRNGNGHITFKRPDLVDRMNQILAKHYPRSLPADRHEDAREFASVSAT